MIAPEHRIDIKTVKRMLFPQLQEETKIYNSFQQILSKIEEDGHLVAVYSLLNHMFEAEKRFALNGLLIRAEEIAKG
jgi:hypothetical protein